MNEEKMVCLSHKHAYTYYNKVMCFCQTCFVLSIPLLKQQANIHAKNDNIGMNAQISLSWKFYIINDLTMFARCGNQQHEMNTNNWVWNAQIIYNFIKGRLMTKPKD